MVCPILGQMNTFLVDPLACERQAPGEIDREIVPPCH
jgi:hypothetical protein